MNEIFIEPLTIEPPKPYSKDEVSFMDEISADINSESNEKSKAKETETKLSPKQKEAIRGAVRKTEAEIRIKKAKGEQISPHEYSSLHLMKRAIGETPAISGGADAVSTVGITHPAIKEALEIINATMYTNLPLQGVLERQVEEVMKAKNVKPEEREIALDRIREISEALEKSEKMAKEESRFGQILRLQESQIQDPILKAYVSEVNSLIDQIRATGQIDNEKYQELYNRINSLQPPESYGVVPTGDDEASRAEARIRNARMDAFELDKQILRSAISQAKKSLIPVGQEAERAVGEAVTKIIKAIKNDDYDAIDKAILDSGFNPSDQRGLYGEVIVRAVEASEEMGNKDYMTEYLLEFGLERVISRADENPFESYPQFSLYESMNIDSIIQAARRYDENKMQNKRGMFGYLTNLQYKRQAMHQLFQGMKDRQTYVQLVTQLLRRNGLDFVEHRIAGVAEVQIIYEQVLGSMLSLKEKGWLNHLDFVKADEEVKDIMKDYEGQDSEFLHKEFKKVNADGTFSTSTRALRPWEITRARMVGRSLNTATERRITYGVLGDLPEGVDERLRSLEFEFIARTLAPLKLVPEKFFDQPVAKRYFEILFEELRKQKKGDALNLNKYGYVGEGKEKGLYGKSQKAFAVLDTGITDLKSNSWRGRLLLLKNKNYLTAEGRPIMVYLDEVKEAVEEKYKKIIKSENPNIKTELELKILMGSEQHGYKKKIKEEFNEIIRDVVGKQRLFLGALAKNASGVLDDENKITIWRNVAGFLPSRIAAFLPEETMDIVGSHYGIEKPSVENKAEMERWKEQVTRKWNEVKKKLFKAERARVKRDAIALKTGGDKQTRELEYFYESAGIDARESEVIKRIKALGVAHAEQFSKISFPFTPFLDDVPETDWDNLEDNDLDRILVRDHSDFEKGYKAITGLIANPAAKPENIIKAFTEGFEGISSPLGIHDAQGKLEPFINAYMRISRLNNWAKYLGPIMKLARSPRSEAEAKNLQSQIAINEGYQSNILNTLAQHDVISDDPTEADEHGKTQLARVKDKNKLDIKALLLMHFRIVAMLFGVVFALEIFKSILPPDAVKELSLA